MCSIKQENKTNKFGIGENSHRKFLIDGGDTFDIVWNNILKIRAKYPSFFNSNVSFNSVRLQDESRRKVVEFFRKNGISDSSISIRDADMDGIDYIYSPLFIDANNRDDDSINKPIPLFNFQMLIISESVAK